MNKYDPNSAAIADNIFEMRFKYASYYSGTLDSTKWEIIHEWCRKSFGIDHYTCVGFTFLFETEAARNWFLLRWGSR